MTTLGGSLQDRNVRSPIQIFINNNPQIFHRNKPGECFRVYEGRFRLTGRLEEKEPILITLGCVKIQTDFDEKP